MIPCDKPIPGASFVCENESNSGVLNLKKVAISRSNREYPSKTINIESSCLHIVNSLSENYYNMEKVCDGINFGVFRLPSFGIH